MFNQPKSAAPTSFLLDPLLLLAIVVVIFGGARTQAFTPSSLGQQLQRTQSIYSKCTKTDYHH